MSEPATNIEFVLGIVLVALAGLAATDLWLRTREREPATAEDLFVCATIAVFFLGYLGIAAVEFGVFRPLVLCAALAALSTAVRLWFRRRVRSPLALKHHTTRPALLVLLASLVAFSPASECLLGGRDQGMYASVGSALADFGRLPVPYATVAEVEPKARVGFVPGYEGRRVTHPGWGSILSEPHFALGFYARHLEPGGITPQFYHALPVALAYGKWIGGIRGLLRAPVVLAVLCLLAVFFVAVRLQGTWLGTGAVLGMLTNYVVLWNFRSPMAEGPACGALMVGFLGLLAAQRDGPFRWLVVAIVAFGWAFFQRPDALVVLPPVVLIVAAGTVNGVWSRRRVMVFLAGVTVLAAWSLVHAWIWSNPYVRYLAPEMRMLATGGATSVAVASVLALLGPKLAPLATTVLHRRNVLFCVAAALFVASVALAIVRPWLFSEPIARVESLWRLAWYVTWPGVLLATVGGVFALRRWIVDGAFGWGLLFGAWLACTVLYLWNPHNATDHPWVARRYVTFVIPGMMLLGSAGFLWLAGLTGARPESEAVAPVPASSSAPLGGKSKNAPGSPRARTTKGRLPTARLLGALAIAVAAIGGQVRISIPIWTMPEQAHGLGSLQVLADAIPDDAIALFEFPSGDGLPATPLRFVFHKGMLPVLPTWDKNRTPAVTALIQQQIATWRDKGRPVYYVGLNDADQVVTIEGRRWVRVNDFQLRHYNYGQHHTAPPWPVGRNFLPVSVFRLE